MGYVQDTQMEFGYTAIRIGYSNWWRISELSARAEHSGILATCKLSNKDVIHKTHGVNIELLNEH